MYQGENAKFDIELKDHDGNVIPWANIEDIQILIYRDSDKKVYLKYAKVHQEGWEYVTAYIDGLKSYFDVTSTQTAALPLGTYILRIKSIVTDINFADGAITNIEETPIFTIKYTVKDDQ